MNAVSRLWKCYRDYGPAETFWRLLHRFRIISINHSLDLFLREFKRLPGEGRNGIPRTVDVGGLQVLLREISLGEVETLKVADGLRYTERESVQKALQRLMKEGGRFFAAFADDRVVALNGIHRSFANLSFIQKPLVRLPEGVVYFNAALTAPDYRNRGIGTALRRHVFSVMQRSGYHGVTLAVFIENKGAIRWQEANGFKRWGRIRYIKGFGREFWRTRLTEMGHRYPNLLAGGTS